MNVRRVRVAARPVYGRMQPIGRPRRRGVKPPRMSGLQQRALVVLGAVLLVGWGIGQLFAIRTINVSSTGRQSAIEGESHKLVDSNYWWGNLITFDDGQFVSKLQQADPLLRNIAVRRRWLHAIVVTATLKQPSMGWDTGNQLYLLDRDGTVLAGVSTTTGLPIVFDGSNLPVQVGQKAVSSHFVEFVDQLVPGLAASGIGVNKLDIKETTLDLTATTNKGYKLLFDTSREVQDELTDLKAVQTLLVSQKKVPAEYIDLRISGKAYYK